MLSPRPFATSSNYWTTILLVLLLSLLAPLIRLLLLLPLDGDERRLDEKDGDDEEVPLPPEPAVTEEESRGRFAVPVARIFSSLRGQFCFLDAEATSARLRNPLHSTPFKIACVNIIIA